MDYGETKNQKMIDYNNTNYLKLLNFTDIVKDSPVEHLMVLCDHFHICTPI
jgi:hypothetical protein